MLQSRLTLLLVLAISLWGRTQDIHFSHVNRQPIYQNPGNTGLFNGDVRFTANYKDQWRSVSVPFQTIAVAADAKWKAKKLNFGVLFFHDNVGDGNLQTIEFLGSVAKQLALTRDSAHQLSVGLQLGLNYRQLSFNKYYFNNQFDGVYFDPTLPTNENLVNAQKSNITIAAGGVYTWKRSTKELITIGLSGHNLNRPNQGFYGTKIQRDRRFSLFALYDRKINTDWAITPGFSLNLQGVYRELVLGSQVRYTLVNKLGSYRAVDGGLWFRNRDAVIIRAGIAIQNWTFALSYDTNISKLIPASSARGGLEMSASYILTRFKPKKVIHRICPDYI